MIKFSADPVRIVEVLAKKAEPTQGLVTLLAEGQRDRILSRTSDGRDYRGRFFAGYSKNGPIYYYPSGSDKTLAVKRRSASRLFRIFTRKPGKSHVGKQNAVKSKRNGEAWVTRGGGLGFSSYAALKRWAGRKGVDLRGLRAPHMLQQLQIRPSRVPRGSAGAVIGIYGPKAEIASGHNKGSRHLPKREFMNASKSDEAQMRKEVEFFYRMSFE